MQKILIVNSNIKQCTILKKTIKNAFPNWKLEIVHCYSDGKILVTESLQNNDYFTLFLLDKNLTMIQKDYSGYELADYIRKYPTYFTTPMLFFATTSEDSLYALTKYHCYNYILKPYTPEQILGEIQQMLYTKVLKRDSLEIRDTNRIVHTISHDDILYFTSNAPHVLTIVTKYNSFSSREYTIDGFLQKL
ncbi:MAG: response regulator [Lachnospiraceae bacterium]|nr:response regulator [Lachnospiraceae bacterium]